MLNTGSAKYNNRGFVDDEHVPFLGSDAIPSPVDLIVPRRWCKFEIFRSGQAPSFESRRSFFPLLCNAIAIYAGQYRLLDTTYVIMRKQLATSRLPSSKL